MLWCSVVVAYALFRTVRPIRYRDDTASVAGVVGEVAIHLVAVAATGFWDSPLVFSLSTGVTIAGFSEGFAFALRVAVASIVAVGIPDLVLVDHEHRDDVQLAVELLLVALVAGYARRISGDADRRRSLAMDRLGRLSDANVLLLSLHRVAQSLPASLDLDETLESTMTQLRSLFDYGAAAILIADEANDRWTVVRREGAQLPAGLPSAGLPAALARVAAGGFLVEEPDLAVHGGPGLATGMRSGLYAALPARGSVIGLVSLEHPLAEHFNRRDVELLEGFVEPAALAIDNARWFARLRTAGAEEERGRIARDLHDSIGQSLAYLAFELDRIVKRQQRGDDVTEALDGLRNDVRGIVSEVRETLYDLRTGVSQEEDLLSVLQLHLDRVKQRSGLDITLRGDDSGRLPLPHEREMFRIAQEAVAAAERRTANEGEAAAHRVDVSWWCDGRSALLEVADHGPVDRDGRATAHDSQHLAEMQTRAEGIGATLHVDARLGGGVRVRCAIGDGHDRAAG